MKPKTVNLRGRIPDAGTIRFLRAEWIEPNPHFVLIRFAMGSKEQEYGLRLDLDKRAILDEIGDAETNQLVKERARDIWGLVAERARTHL